MLSLTSENRTFYHSIPAGLKLLILLVASVLLFIFPDAKIQFVTFGIAVFLFIIGGFSFFLQGLKHLIRIWPVVLCIGLWHLWSQDYETGAALILRLATVIALANLVTMTTPLTEMISVLHWLTSPLRRLGMSTRPGEIAVAMVIRFIPVLSEKSDAIRESWCARSARRAGWQIVTPIALVAIDDAEQVSEALRARGGLSSPPDTCG